MEEDDLEKVSDCEGFIGQYADVLVETCEVKEPLREQREPLNDLRADLEALMADLRAR